jgi:hypothetical protein
MCPNFDSWGWFASLLIAMEERCAAAGDDGFLKIRVFQTRGWTDDDARKVRLAFCLLPFFTFFTYKQMYV